VKDCQERDPDFPARSLSLSAALAILAAAFAVAAFF
jgi:hypothetical protein